MNLLNVLPPVAWLTISASFFAVGEYLSRKFADAPSWKLVLFICLTYLIGTLTWLPAIVQTKKLAATGMAWLLLSIVATLGIGLGVFHERVDHFQMAGIVLAVVALILLNHQPH